MGPGGLGSLTTQSARRLFDSVTWNSKADGGNAFCTRSWSWISPNGPAGLLVGEDVLQADDVTAQFRNILLRRIEDVEVFLEIAQRLGGTGRRLLESFAQAAGDAVQSLVEHAPHLGLAYRRGFGDLGHPSTHFPLGADQEDSEEDGARHHDGRHDGDDDEGRHVHQHMFRECINPILPRRSAGP